MEDRGLRPAGRGGPPRDLRRRLLSLSRGPKTRTAGADSEAVVGGSLTGMIIAAVCFLVILAAIGWGIYEVYRIGHPAPAK